MEQLIILLKKNILVLIVGIAGLAWAYIQEGVKADIHKVIDERIESKVNDSQLVSTLLESKQVKEFTEQAGQDIRDKIITDVTKKDSSKINQSAFLGKELGIRDEAVTPLLRDLLKDYKEGNLATKTDVEKATGRRVTPNTIGL